MRRVFSSKPEIEAGLVATITSGLRRELGGMRTILIWINGGEPEDDLDSLPFNPPEGLELTSKHCNARYCFWIGADCPIQPANASNPFALLRTRRQRPRWPRRQSA